MHGPIFSDMNFRLLGISIVLLVIGYICLGQGPVYNHISWSVAPIILVFVYCILIPVAILYREKENTTTKDTTKKDKGV
jgi:hypothetical protein